MTANLKTIKASEFKAKCLGLMDQVADSGQELIITKNQKPIAKLSPYRKPLKTLFGIDKGKIKVTGNIMDPIEVDWEAAFTQDQDDLA